MQTVLTKEQPSTSWGRTYADLYPVMQQVLLRENKMRRETQPKRTGEWKMNRVFFRWFDSKLCGRFVVKSCFKAFANDYKRLGADIGAMVFFSNQFYKQLKINGQMSRFLYLSCVQFREYKSCR
jgi:hypothetical protein